MFLLTRTKACPTKQSSGRLTAAADFVVEAVGKVPDQFFAGDAQKSALVNGSTIDDLMLENGKVTPENSVKTVKATFSTASLDNNVREA